ncbi:MAG: PEP-CTERM sorting domain-containing protein, partial [Microcystis sp.]|uniref:PEP-CTERM sorting domain-containing protein n=1 Tax=Microcystis sp. TaxID=1127 RepID=UPI00391C21DB
GNGNFRSIVFGTKTNDLDIFQIDSASLASVASVPVSVPEPGMITGLVFLGSGLVVRRLAKRR